ACQSDAQFRMKVTLAHPLSGEGEEVNRDVAQKVLEVLLRASSFWFLLPWTKAIPEQGRVP
ncbi:MAG: hypothetical protein KAV98_01270, partial [Dehalococcoidia bacterium]|nr:hypothetical protein [Dehalococcoidia bacterium]